MNTRVSPIRLFAGGEKMLSRAPGCRSVCNGTPGDVVDDLAAAFRAMRVKGTSEAEALRFARDPVELARLCSERSLGSLKGVAEVLVFSGCAECAVNLAYSD